jgi:hypothetical protein
MKKTSPSSLSAEERALRSKLHQLLCRAEGLAHGSLVEMKRRCGKPNCRCASDDAFKHSSLYLSQTRNGKTRMIYIPKDLEETVRRWVADFRRASELLEAVSREGWRRIAEKKVAAKPSRGRAGPRKPATPAKPS